MNYVIKNSMNLYIRLHNGKPVTCPEHEKTLFEKSKANNILHSLPKKLRKLKFNVEQVSDVIISKQNMVSENKILQTENYIVSDQIKQWIEKFEICDDILKEAKERKMNWTRLFLIMIVQLVIGCMRLNWKRKRMLVKDILNIEI